MSNASSRYIIKHVFYFPGLFESNNIRNNQNMNFRIASIKSTKEIMHPFGSE